MNRKSAVLAAVAAALVAGDAFATTKTANVTVSANVPKNCVINAGTLAFGTYDPIVTNASANLDMTGSISVVCTKSVGWAIGLGAGQNSANVPGGVTATRAMVDTGSYLGYEIYTDATRGTVWDNTNTVGLTGSGASQSLTLYGRIPAGQTGAAASIAGYGDTVLATVNF
jgi:spore coat protein U-like protein